jgi:hypothetical protein
MKSKHFHIVHINLDDKHLRKLADGKGIMLNGGMLSDQGHPIHLSTKQKNAIHKKVSKGKKHTLKFDPDEYHANIELQEGGALFKHLNRFIRNAGKKIAEFYRENLREPVGSKIKDVVKTTAEKIIPMALSGITGLVSPETVPLINPLLEKVGEKVAPKITKFVGDKTGLYETGSGIMVLPDHPSQNPPASVRDLTGRGLFLSGSGQDGKGLYLRGEGASFKIRKHPNPRFNPLVR